MSLDFLTEYKKLQLKTPRLSSFILNSENSNYCYNVENVKNCYLIANGVENEDCMYGRDYYGDRDCIDCDHVRGCTLCYQCLNCENCYNCDFLQDCLNCNDCKYGYFLKGCENCVGCVGLKQKKFHIFNQPYQEKQYREKLAELSSGQINEEFERLKLQVPRVDCLQVNSEGFTGNGIYHSKNIVDSFDVSECQDGGYLLECKTVTDSWDITVLEQAQLCYQISSCHVMNNSNFCFFCVECSDIEYGECLMSCQNCFGCISLHRKQYYILNQPYSADQYFKKVAELKDQIRAQGLYGKMIIPSVFPREDTVANWPTM